MKFLLDENLPRRLAALLRKRGFAVVEVAASNRRSLPDSDIWALAAKEDLVLITRDLDFPLPGIRPAPPAVILLRAPDRATAPDLETLLLSFLDAAVLDTIAGQSVSVRPGRIRMHPLP